MTDTTPSEAVARAHAFAAVHRGLLGGGAEARFGRFTLRRQLGRGAQGRVYAAFDPTLEREVALKLMAADSPGALERGLAEGRALAKLRHPNLVRIHDVVQEEGVIALAMERVDGPTLREWVQAGPSRVEIVGALLAVARGLVALHAAGLTHRDVKPTNVVVDRELGPQIIDLGLARELEGQPTGSHRSGTPEYRAPEQRDGLEVGPSVDQYAWAVVAWEALSGTRPAGATADASGIPRALVPVLRRALAEDPADRFESMAALVGAVQRRRRVKGWARGLAAALVGVVGVVGAQWLLDARDGCEEPDPALVGLWDREQLRDDLGELAGPGGLADHIVVELEADHRALLEVDRWVCQEEALGRAREDERFCVAEAAAELELTVQTLSELDADSLADGADLVARVPTPSACRTHPQARPEGAGDLRALARARGTLRGLGSACPVIGVEACTARFDAVATTDDCTLAPIAAFERGRGLLAAGLDDDAYEHLSTAAWGADACGLAHVELSAKRHGAALAARRGDFEQARWWLAAAEAARGRLPDGDERRGELALTRGIVLALEGDPQRSLAALREAVEALPAGEQQAVAYVNLGQSARKAGQYAEAVEAIEAGLALTRQRVGDAHPSVGRTLTALAIARYQAGDQDAAASTVQEAIALFAGWGDRYPVDLAQALNNLGNMHRAAERFDEATDAYARSLALTGPGPESIETLHNLGGLIAMQGDLDRAQTELEDALRRAREVWGSDHPRADKIAISLANVHLRKSDNDTAGAVACPAAARARARLGHDHSTTVRADAICSAARGEPTEP